jgi:transposase
MQVMKKKSGLPVLYPNAAGIDISSREHFVAVNPAVNENPIRSFGCFTDDLHAIANWLRECHVDTVAMEATGIYWVSLYLILEESGLNVVLVNAKHVKNVSGKKTDVKDAEWIRQLHSCGLLSSSFQPDMFTRTLRTFMRHRKNLIEMAATHIRMMQKAMEQMNIKLQNVIADITGKSGQRIITAILQGERRPEALIELLDGRIKASREVVSKSLLGLWKEEHVFELRQSFELYQIYRKKIKEFDEEIKAHLETKIKERDRENEQTVQISGGIKARSNKNNLSFDAKHILQEITGTDLTEIFGINDSTAIEILSETGLDMNKWPTEKHFSSWLNLAPNNKISGGRLLSSKIPRKKNRAGQVFKMAAFAVQRSNNWLGSFYHRIKARSGPAKAITATARKIAVIFYRMVRDKIMFNPITMETYNQAFRNKQIAKLKKQAKMLGLEIKPIQVT